MIIDTSQAGFLRRAIVYSIGARIFVIILHLQFSLLFRIYAGTVRDGFTVLAELRVSSLIVNKIITD